MRPKLFLYDFVDDFLLRSIAGRVESFRNEGKTSFDLHISSNGGNVFDGLAIYNLLRAYDVDVYIDGIAASIASVIAMAGNNIYINESAMVMIHNPWTFAGGDEDYFAKVQSEMKMIKDNIVKAYQSHVSMSDNEINDLMSVETYMTADQAVEKGFATEIIKQVDRAKNYAAFLNQIEHPLIPHEGLGKTGVKKMDIEKLRNLLDMPEAATEEEVLNRVKELKAEAEAEAEAKVEAETALEKRIVNLEKSITAERETKIQEKLNSAVAQGKITEDEKPVWAKALNDDFAGNCERLDKIPANTLAQPVGEPANNKLPASNAEKLQNYYRNKYQK
jgi:ATP-dependent Clp protease protease subunit